MIEKIFNTINDNYGFSKETLLSKDKHKQVADLRGITYYLLHYHANLSSKDIATIFYRKKRSIQKSCATFKFLIENQEYYKNLYESLRNKI